MQHCKGTATVLGVVVSLFIFDFSQIWTAFLFLSFFLFNLTIRCLNFFVDPTYVSLLVTLKGSKLEKMSGCHKWSAIR